MATRTSVTEGTTGPRLYLLQGPPAVGKLALARELERRTGAIVVDNHLANNAVFVPMGLGRAPEVTLEQTDALRRRVIDVVFEATLAAPARLSHVFTYWLPDAPDNDALVTRLRTLAERRGARFVPVWLTASREALLARIAAPGRAERSKLVDPETLQELLETPLMPAPPGAAILDLSETTPAEAVEGLLAVLD